MRPSPTVAVSASSSISRSLSASPPSSSPAAGLALERLHDRRGRARADVGHDQRLLEAFPGVLVEHAEQRRLDLAAERLARLGHALAQAPEEAAALAPGALARDRPRGRRRTARAPPVMNRSLQSRATGRATIAARVGRGSRAGARALAQAAPATAATRAAARARPAGAARAPWRRRPGPSRRRTASRRPPSCASGA